MFEVSMVIFAVAMLAGVSVVARSITSELRATELRTESTLRAHAVAIQGLRKVTAMQTPAALKAELDDLRGALDVIRASNRKELGALWGKMGGRGSNNGKVFDNDTGQPLEGDDELQALLALQTAKPVQPNS